MADRTTAEKFHPAWACLTCCFPKGTCAILVLENNRSLTRVVSVEDMA